LCKDSDLGRLTTHVLDTARGRPAAGLTLELHRIEPDTARLATVTTNADGRLDTPLLTGESMQPGVYELRFHAGRYLRLHGGATEDPLFLDVIPIRFGIASADEHYHVPLLLSPFGYSTYRGS
jgi:5-hydroxyisourate hydrolase